MPTGLHRYQQEATLHHIQLPSPAPIPEHPHRPRQVPILPRINPQAIPLRGHGLRRHARTRPPSPRPGVSPQHSLTVPKVGGSAPVLPQGPLCYSSSNGGAPMNTATAITLAALAALTPTVTCLIGIILQRSDVRDLRSEVRDLRSDMFAMRKDINVEMQAFRKDVHADLLMIHERVATVEGRQTR